MNRWTSIAGALLLVLLLWTGSAAHAVEPFDCVTTTAQASDLGGETGDQPLCPKNCAAHHCGCSSHNIMASPDLHTVDFAIAQEMIPFAWRESGRLGRGPDSQLRPPIA